MATISSDVQFIDAGGLRFGYLTEGSGPLVLLVHGFPDTPHTWRHVMPALAKAGYRAVAPFTRGIAPSAVPADGVYGSDTLGRDLLALIEALGGGPAVVVGHDWGASAAYSAAALGPEKVRLLVTMAIPHPRSIKPSLGLLWQMRHFFVLGARGGAGRLRRNDFAYVDTLAKRWSRTWDIPVDEFRATKDAYAPAGSAEAACAYYAQVRRKPPEGHRQKISVPTVSIAGADDVVAPAAYERARRCFTGVYEVVTVPGGHFMHREQPAAFEAALLGALARHAPPPSATAGSPA